MKLIREEVQEVQFLIQEDKATGKKGYFIEGVFCQADKQNKNGRVYPFETLRKEVERYNKDYVEKGRALGELGHPDTPSINLDRVSHMITSLKPDGTNFMGKAKILDTPMGNTVKGLLDGGVTIGVSTRGVGSLKPHNGYQLVQDDFKLATAADIVADPSAPDAFVRGIMENVNWVWDNGIWKEADLESAKREVKAVSRKEIDAVAIRLFEQFMSKMSKL
jgi:Prohead core protein serine protease